MKVLISIVLINLVLGVLFFKYMIDHVDSVGVLHFVLMLMLSGIVVWGLNRLKNRSWTK